jgi:transposase
MIAFSRSHSGLPCGREHGLAESVLLRWRKEFEARGEAAFTDKQPSSREEALEAAEKPSWRDSAASSL